MLHGRALRGGLAREGAQRLRGAHVARRGEIVSCGAAHFFGRAWHATAIAVIAHRLAFTVRPAGEGLVTDAVERGDARHCGERDGDIALARILLVEPRGEGPPRLRLPRTPSPHPRTRT